MVNFTVDQIRGMMNKPHNIRCLSVIAHVDHGKSTLTDSLIGAAGIIAEKKAGDTRFMDTREDEQDRTITIKSTGVSLHFSLDKKKFVTRQKEIKRYELVEANPKKKDRETEEYKEKVAAVKAYVPPECAASFTEKKTGEEKIPFLINLIDSPGHVDFSSEVTAALRVTDGALVVVDCIEGVCVQTETVLRQAIAERIRPVLWVNKLDRIFLELHMPAEEAYQSFSRAIESANVIIANYQDDLLGEISVVPEKGTVGFGSGLHGWGFTLEIFADMYSKKLALNRIKCMQKLWGESYISAKGKFFSAQYSKKGKARERAFCKMIMEPINDLCEAVMQEKKDVYTKILENIGVTIPKDARDLARKPLLKRIMQTWLPAAQALLGMIANFLPSPAKAQKYRVSNLYSGPLDDEAARAIMTCNPKGPLMMYISKMIPTNEKGRFYAFGRVFSGTVATGMEVRIQGPDYTPGRKADLHVKKIQRTVLMMGRYIEQLPDVPCGNTCGLVGVDQYLTKSGTITTYDKAHNFVDMKYSVSPVVKVSVDVKNAADLPKLMEGLKRLSKSDPLVQCYTAKTGEHIIAGCGELHLQICLKDLAEQYMKGAPIVEGQPVVSFCETITSETPKDIVGKSANKHNRLYITASPMSKILVDLIDEGVISANQDFKKRARIIVDETKGEMDLQSARKIWSFGIEDAKQNILVDMTKGVAYLNEIKDSVKTAFQQACCAGILCGEAIRGMMIEVNDVVLHADAIHRGAGQIMPPMKRAIFGCQIASAPRLMEPMFLCDITVPMDGLNGVYNTLSQRRGEVSEEISKAGTPLTQIKAFLPVLESFGFTGLLRENTSGMAFPQMIFSHWQLMMGEMYAEDAKLKKLMPLESSFAIEKALEVRKRKGLKEIMPMLEDYSDKV
mmetsp:Transcript_5129/g.9437  ORF Transcript_5129/g.9437 Transcript_5129/m.9437 type:complete len:902 (-) Transcript_5129:250-2955(-)|eukprot:CAMPEP_0197518088 /NCGR_PEP_ID=MMETSP1318-20131121/3196_1 /TAXON_ID=552666 /ORGANISM="Partenskyella glossopodia, Strain RCC365" /LENGTH=901 /DNA_ID=CAMNT_0043068151 /DNA_START=60 /DNA_END=2765 /DNA_ORIENTATION=+